MSSINNDPTFGFIGHSTIERGRSGLITVEVIEGSELAEATNAATIASTLYLGKRKKERKIGWKVGEMRTDTFRIGELSVKEIERYTKGISTKAGFYADINPPIDLPIVEKEVKIYLTEEEILECVKGKSFGYIDPKGNINAAKAEILKAIEEIAEKEDVKLRNKDKEELANLSIMLLKKIGEEI